MSFQFLNRLFQFFYSALDSGDLIGGGLAWPFAFGASVVIPFASVVGLISERQLFFPSFASETLVFSVVVAFAVDLAIVVAVFSLSLLFVLLAANQFAIRIKYRVFCALVQIFLCWRFAFVSLSKFVHQVVFTHGFSLARLQFRNESVPRQLLLC